MSGYLLTHPPEGKERLVGADASHAWIAVWCPDFGWVEFDPTNNLMPSDEHIALAWGRDYGDVSPTTGIIVGGGAHTVVGGRQRGIRYRLISPVRRPHRAVCACFRNLAAMAFPLSCVRSAFL